LLPTFGGLERAGRQSDARHADLGDDAADEPHDGAQRVRGRAGVGPETSVRCRGILVVLRERPQRGRQPVLVCGGL
ncbi:unnamed protein product, partial [Ectocarpus sp. 12 AP-2014]